MAGGSVGGARWNTALPRAAPPGFVLPSADDLCRCRPPVDPPVMHMRSRRVEVWARGGEQREQIVDE